MEWQDTYKMYPVPLKDTAHLLKHTAHLLKHTAHLLNNTAHLFISYYLQFIFLSL